MVYKSEGACGSEKICWCVVPPGSISGSMQKKFGRLETGTPTTVMHKLRPFGGFSGLFCPYCAYLAGMQTPALLPLMAHHMPCLANGETMHK